MGIDEKIIRFIKKHHVLTLATTIGNSPWCSNMFYAYDPKRNIFIFTSDDTTRHASEASANNTVAASIVLETRVVGKVQGLQMTGSLCRAEEKNYPTAKHTYIKRFPYAAAADLNLWILEPDFYKLTDNTLGFGKKIVWQKQ